MSAYEGRMTRRNDEARKARIIAEVASEKFEAKQMELLLKISKNGFINHELFKQAVEATTENELALHEEKLQELLTIKETEEKARLQAPSPHVAMLAGVAHG